ncbi:MAG TPA: (Fe-S)-binding protein [Methanocella sp.]|jgi:Fe-S oxidoreductase
MPIAPGRKLALFLSFVLLVTGLLTLVPDTWLLGSPGCHTCHESQYPVDHLLYRLNYLGYNSLCSFAPISSLALIGLSIVLFATAFRFRFERWGRDYRLIGAGFCLVMAVITVLPLNMPYRNLIGGSTLDPFVPLSTAALVVLGIVAYSGYLVCPFLMFWRSRCPTLEHDLDVWQSPHRSINRLLKLTLTGKLNDGDMKSLYACTLCNGCYLAPVQRLTRNMAVRKGIVASHLTTIKGSVGMTGNAYGVVADGGTAVTGDQSSDTLLFVGCTARYRTPEILAAATKLLDAKGIKYRMMADETCCGYTLYNLGDRQASDRAVSANIAKFKAAGVKHIITICPGCYEAFHKLYKGREGFLPEVTLALDLMKAERVDVKDIIVHDPCHAKRHDVVREIVTNAGDESTGGCCGAGGGLISWDRMIAESRAKRLISESGRKVVTYCPLCYLNYKRADPEKVADLYVLMASQT